VSVGYAAIHVTSASLRRGRRSARPASHTVAHAAQAGVAQRSTRHETFCARKTPAPALLSRARET
jgi:hypothetical protein